mmetsp:Transcript_89245/g.288459  ORF Transcript_89245/g.288459 Transcript_89245/m.288459 type:complete len:451 (-) Transcript_89245:79-1431(-)
MTGDGDEDSDTEFESEDESAECASDGFDRPRDKTLPPRVAAFAALGEGLVRADGDPADVVAALASRLDARQVGEMAGIAELFGIDDETADKGEKKRKEKDKEKEKGNGSRLTTTAGSGYYIYSVEKRVQATDVQGGQGHRAREWRGAVAYDGDRGPIEVVRQMQKRWAQEHPEQLLKWAFPTKRRDCLRISLRSIEKMEGLTTNSFRAAFGELAHGCPPSVLRTMVYLYLNYLQPHHRRIQAQGRHLLMIKVYESKSEASCWHIPLREVRDLHRQAAEAMIGGVSLNDVQLVETYAVENSFALHTETFACPSGGDRGNMYGKCTWVGGMALHLITEDDHSPLPDKSQEFAMVPDEDLAELAERQAKLRDKRARKKASQKQKKAEVQASQAAEAQLVKEQEQTEAAAKRREGLLQPHASLSRFFEDAAPRKREGLIQPHESLSRMFKSGAF